MCLFGLSRGWYGRNRDFCITTFDKIVDTIVFVWPLTCSKHPRSPPNSQIHLSYDIFKFEIFLQQTYRPRRNPPLGGCGGTGFSDRCDLINGCWVVWATCWDSLDTTEVKNWANIRQYKVNISKISLLALFVDNYPMRWACSFHTDFLWRSSTSKQKIVPYWYHFWDAPRAQDELMTLK